MRKPRKKAAVYSRPQSGPGVDEQISDLHLVEAPHDLIAEQALLGALLFDNKVANRLPPGLDQYAFFDPLHQTIFAEVISTIAEKKRVDAGTIGERLHGLDSVAPDLAVPDYLLKLCLGVPTVIAAPDYAMTILDLARKRWRLIRDVTWKNDLIKSATGVPKPILANAITALSAAPWKARLGYDEFAMTTMALAPLPFENETTDFKARRWTPGDDALATNYLQHEGLSCGIEIVQQAVETVARSNSFHPARDYLQRVVWDRRPRLDRFLTTHLGATASAYASAVGRCTLISAVARVMKPGCKADHVMVIEGVQGIGKSSALSALAGQFYTDELGDFGSKDAAMQTRGVMLIEISELDAMSRAEVSRIKAFISRTVDRFRPPYGRRVIESPRECIFIGTTNAETYLKDETGGRRFWPIKAGKIDVDAIKRDRDQLWAEAVHRFEKGERWWLDAEEAVLASAEQQARYVDDAWQALIENYLQTRTQVTVSEILSDALAIEYGRQGQTEQNRVARCLRQMGWSRHQKRAPGGRRHWFYTRDTDTKPLPLDVDDMPVTTRKPVTA